MVTDALWRGDNGTSSFLCVKKDTQSLYNAIQRFAKLSIAEKEQVGLRGRGHMKNEFDKNIFVEKTIKIFNFGE